MYDLGKDDLLDEAVKVILQYDRVSASLLQRRLSIGYARAARIIDQLESLKLIAESDGSSSPREVFIKSFEEYKKANTNDHIVGADELSEVVDKYNPVEASFLPREFDKFNNPDELILGKNTENEKAVSVKFSQIGNLIITGTPISKKIEFVETYLISILSNFRTSQIKLIIHDTASYLKIFEKTPHLLCPVVTDQDKHISALRWTIYEINRRTEKVIKDPNFSDSKIVFIMNSPDFDVEVEDAVKRITSLGTKVGVHIMLIEDSIKDIPRLIRDNIPARLNFLATGENVAKFDFKEHLMLNTFVFENKKVRGYLDNLKTS
ncbi:MAG: DNA translocase FtsK [Patescibacteria group bacterium]